MSIEEAVVILLEALMVVVGAWLQAPITTLLVNVIKRFIPSANPEAARFLFAVGFTILSWIAVNLGFGLEFDNLISVIAQIGAILWGYYENSMRATRIYLTAAAANESQLFGYQRAEDDGERRAA